MEKVKTKSEFSNKRTYLLLALNILGVIICVCCTIILTLWALDLIFQEPMIDDVILDYIKLMKSQNHTSWRVPNTHMIWNVFARVLE